MKAQAAMEFLLTYGWAIAVLLLMVSGLAYLGVLDPREWVPDKCTFSAGIGCREFVVASEAPGERINILLTNNFGDTIVVNEVIVTDLDGTASCDKSGSTLGIGGVWKSADPKTLDFTCPNPVDRVNLNIRIEYKYLDGKYDRITEGRLQAKVN